MTVDRDRTGEITVFEQGHGQITPHAFFAVGFRYHALRVGEHVRDIYWPFFKSDTTQCTFPPRPNRCTLYIRLQLFRNVFPQHSPEGLAIESKHCAVLRLAEANRILEDGLKNRLNIRGRAGDHTQDFAGRRLLLQRLFQFLKQPYVLDRYDRLIGKGFKQLDLHRREGARLDATREQCANQFVLLRKRNAQIGAPDSTRTQHWKIVLR